MTIAKSARRTGLLKPNYSSADLILLEEMRSGLAVANALLSARLGLGLSQAALALQAATKQSRISEIESMTGNPRFDTLDRVSRAVGLMVTLVPREQTPGTVSFPSFQGTVPAGSFEQTLRSTSPLRLTASLDPQSVVDLVSGATLSR